MAALSAASLWVGAHLVAYVVGLRHWHVLHSEKGILAYHVLSVTTLAVALATGVLAWPGLLHAAGAVALHGVYSMTFLCLWSSSQGGFALRLMQRLADGPIERQALEKAFGRWADGKQGVRLAGLQRAGLLELQPHGYRATRRGAALAAALRVMRAVNHLERTG